MKYKKSPLLACALALAGGLTAERAYGADVIVNINFNTDPSASNLYVERGNGAAYWSPNGGASGAANDGFIAITDARGGQNSSITFNDTPETEGLVVSAFKFECDLRIGGGTARPADGFSLNYVRNPSDYLTTVDGGGDPIGANFNGTDGETSLPEEGVREGLGIGFDTWESGPIGGVQDVVGISVRYNTALITQFPVPLQPGNVFPGGTYDEVPYRNLATTAANYKFSMQTGALSSQDLNGDGVVDGGDANAAQPTPDDPTWGKWIENLVWEKFATEVDANGFVKVFWKGVELTPTGGFKTSFTPYKGRVVLAGRTGGAWEVHHVDNIKLTLSPSSVPIWGGVTGNPVGFDTAISDSGTVLDPATLVVKLDGVVVTPKSVTKNGGTTTIRVYDVGTPMVAGSVHKVIVTAKSTVGQDVQGSGTEKEFTVLPYVAVPAALAVTADTTKPGFKIRWNQVADGQETTIARAEQQLYGLRGPNLFTSPADVEEVPGVINYDQAGANAGNWNGNTDPVGTYTETLLPLPDPTYTDNIAAAIETYVVFPEAGVYNLIFNSDDGFRTTMGGNVGDVQSSVLVGQADVGRGAADTVSTVYVPTAGAYPLRTVWFEGGGGANMEWVGEQTLPTIMGRALLNDVNKPSLKTYLARTDAAPAGVSFVFPCRSTGNPYLPAVPIIVELTQGAAAISQGTIMMTLNGTMVTPTVTPGAGKFTLNFKPAVNLPVGNNTLKIEFTAGAQQYVGESTFVVRDVRVVPPSLALPASAVNKANIGFLAKVRQQDSDESMGNDTYRGLVQAAGFIGFPNSVDPTPFTGPSGYYQETSVLNWDQASGNSGFFNGNNGFADAAIPGIPGNAPHDVDGPTDNFTGEILTVLDLQAGVYAMNVNSDDGFWLSIGNPAEVWTFPVVVGEFSGGRGSGGGNLSGTTFYFEIKQAGLYPARLIWYEGGGGANVEWSSFLLDTYGILGAHALINDVNTPGHVKAYQYPLSAPGSPYVKSFKPARNGRSSAASNARAGHNTDVVIELVDGNGNINPETITMTIDGATVLPTATKTGGVTTVRYAPATHFGPNATVNVALTFGDRTITRQFLTGDIGTPAFFIEAEDFNTGGGQAPAAASVLPYFGGAFSGLSAVADVDYSRPNEDASPLYRMDEEPSVPMDRTGDRNRGFMDIAVNYKIGWVGSGQWYNYTRTFPAGKYNVYVALSHGDPPASGTIGGRLGRVTSSPSQPNQTVEDLGAFDAPRTGGWGNNALVPLRDGENNMVALDLAGTQTLRFTTRDADYDFILFTLAPTERPMITGITRNTDGSLTITWTGGGTLQAAPTVSGSWEDVTGATSPFTFTPTAAALFGRIRQ